MTDTKPLTDTKQILDPVPTLCGNMIGTWDGRFFGCKQPRGHEGPHVDGDVTWAKKP